MTNSETVAWAARAPHWASPPYFIHDGTVRSRRSDVVELTGEAWARHNETPRRGWKRAYAVGWRIVRVRITPVEDAA